MAELITGALLSSFLQVAFEKLASTQALDFFHRKKLDEKLLNNLKIKLNSIQALADDAELKQFRHSQVSYWLLKVKDIVFDAEDLLDEIQYEFSKWEVEAEAESQTCTDCTWKVLNFFISSPASSFNKEINLRMEQVLECLEFLSNQKDDLGLKNASGIGVGSELGRELPHILQSTCLKVESDIYGRDEDKKRIFDWLTSDNDNPNQPWILSIVGMGGMGKTALAQHVFNDPRIEEAEFDVKAWVCVSIDFDVFKVSRTILEAITKSTDDSRDLEMVHGRLKDKLTGKKFLLVLDNVWNENLHDWEAVQTPLVSGGQGSRIIATTRSKLVASTMMSKEHLLEQLQEDHCWKLFAKHAFQDDNVQPNPDCKEIGMKIIEKCEGLPLALKAMGSLVHKSSVSEWEKILQREIWGFSADGEPRRSSVIIPALALSYHHLPSHLKRCFAYCALFPKDHVFDKECLIQLWMAENFLQCQQGKSPEEVGEQYFNILLSRSFFRQSSNKERTGFVMHDLLNDLAKRICGEICFRLEDNQVKGTPKATRHFSVAINHVQCFDGFGTLCDTKKLRTYMPTGEGMHFHRNDCDGNMSIDEFFSKFKFLRVLSLSGYSNLTEVPDSVGNLKYLRSLDLSKTEIEKLPESTCSLYNLQILKLNYCERLEELPSNLYKLIDLHRLELIKTGVRKVPAHLGGLKYLQVLMSPFKVGEGREFSIQQLGELNLHGSLSIEGLQNVVNPSDALAVGLKNKTHLLEVELQWDLDRNPDDSAKESHGNVIENLQPSEHLKNLTMRNYGGKQFPRWLLNNSSLKVASLTLENCESCQRLPPLGLLPCLKYLKIDGLNGILSIDAEFYGNSSSSFTSLETLVLWRMEQWEKWESGAFPRLKDLDICDCPKLKGHLPEQLLCLQTLKIQKCKQFMASAPMAPEIRNLVLEDCGKLQFDCHPTTLKILHVSGQSMDASSMESIRHIISVSSLQDLSVDSCLSMNIPMSCCQGFLVRLNIDGGCDSLTTIPLDIFPILRELGIEKCLNLQRISQVHAHNHLEHLKVKECCQLESLPEGMHVLLPSLNGLSIYDCPKVEMFPEGGLPSNLKTMTLYGCSKLISSLKSALRGNHSLESLFIGEVDVDSLPEEGLLPHSLVTLQIRDCGDLKRLDYKDLFHLSSLKELSLEHCPSLQFLPEEGLPISISILKIINCPLLKQRCGEPGGDYLPKIAHIDCVIIR